MENQKKIDAKALNKIIVRNAFIAALVYILYFFIMKVAGLIYITELRFINYALYAIIGYYALKAVKRDGGGTIYYLQGLGVSFIVGALSFVFFGIFVFFYSLINPFFNETIWSMYPTANVLGQFTAPFLIASEGIGMSVILSLCLMQYFRIFTTRRRKFLFFGKERLVLSPEE
jgi:hypothetical protein